MQKHRFTNPYEGVDHSARPSRLLYHRHHDHNHHHRRRHRRHYRHHFHHQQHYRSLQSSAKVPYLTGTYSFFAAKCHAVLASTDSRDSFVLSIRSVECRSEPFVQSLRVAAVLPREQAIDEATLFEAIPRHRKLDLVSARGEGVMKPSLDRKSVRLHCLKQEGAEGLISDVLPCDLAGPVGALQPIWDGSQAPLYWFMYGSLQGSRIERQECLTSETLIGDCLSTLDLLHRGPRHVYTNFSRIVCGLGVGALTTTQLIEPRAYFWLWSGFNQQEFHFTIPVFCQAAL